MWSNEVRRAHVRRWRRLEGLKRARSIHVKLFRFSLRTTAMVGETGFARKLALYANELFGHTFSWSSAMLLPD